MYATLEQFLKMTPSKQSQVTHLDLLIATDNDRVKMRLDTTTLATSLILMHNELRD